MKIFEWFKPKPKSKPIDDYNTYFDEFWQETKELQKNLDDKKSKEQNWVEAEKLADQYLGGKIC